MCFGFFQFFDNRFRSSFLFLQPLELILELLLVFCKMHLISLANELCLLLLLDDWVDLGLMRVQFACCWRLQIYIVFGNDLFRMVSFNFFRLHLDLLLLDLNVLFVWCLTFRCFLQVL